MSYPPVLIRLLRTAVALVFVGVAGWYSPVVSAGIWHVFHPGGWVKYRGLHVRVPWPWTADTDLVGSDPTVDPEGLALKKVPFTANHRSTSDTIFVTVISSDPGTTPKQQTDAWMETFRETHQDDLFNEKTPIALPAQASCLAALSSAGDQRLVWTCISVTGGWVMNFEGPSADEPVFFDILGHLKQ